METHETQETGSESAAPPTVETTEAKETKSEKPWIAAGFKSRDEWRKSKGQKASKASAGKPAKAKPVKAKPAKKPAKAAKPAKKVAKSAKPAAKSAKTAKEKREAHERTRHFLKVTAKREEPNEKEAKVLAAFGGKGKTRTIADLASKAFPSRPKAQARSWVRNCLRWIAASKHAKKVGDGEYTRIA